MDAQRERTGLAVGACLEGARDVDDAHPHRVPGEAPQLAWFEEQILDRVVGIDLGELRAEHEVVPTDVLPECSPSIEVECEQALDFHRLVRAGLTGHPVLLRLVGDEVTRIPRSILGDRNVVAVLLRSPPEMLPTPGVADRDQVSRHCPRVVDPLGDRAVVSGGLVDQADVAVPGEWLAQPHEPWVGVVVDSLGATPIAEALVDRTHRGPQHHDRLGAFAVYLHRPLHHHAQVAAATELRVRADSGHTRDRGGPAVQPHLPGDPLRR